MNLIYQTKRIFDCFFEIVQNIKDSVIIESIQKLIPNFFIIDDKNFEKKYADFLAQTIIYCYFFGWVKYCLNNNSPKDFSKDLIQDYLQSDNLSIHSILDLIITISHEKLDKNIEGIITVLRNSNFKKIFPKRNQIYQKYLIDFYEKFIHGYNSQIQKDHGVVFTPIPVVDYILQSIDFLLKNKFALPEGLFSFESKGQPIVKYLDPATGTMTFPSRLAFLAKSKYNENMPLFHAWINEIFMKRVFACEIMVAPFFLGHFIIQGILQELGYKTHSEDTFHLFLNNTLNISILDVSKSSKSMDNFLQQEFLNVMGLSQTENISVIMGNPPYNTNNKMQNQSQAIIELLKDYKEDVTIDNLKRLQDDYVRFFRIAHYIIEKNEQGIIGFITNNTYLDGPSYVGMRKALYTFFDEIYILNLHGNQRKNYRGIEDQNIFDVKVGVAIIFLVRSKVRRLEKALHYYELWGKKKTKLDFLTESSNKFEALLNNHKFEKFAVQPPEYRFLKIHLTPDQAHALNRFKTFPSVTDIFMEHRTGTFTHRDRLVVSDRESTLQENLALFFKGELTKLEERGIKITNTRDWNYENVIKNKLTDLSNAMKNRKRYLYRGFLRKYLIFDQALLEPGCDRKDAQMQISPENPALLLTSGLRVLPYNHVFITDIPVDSNAFRFSSAEFFPLKWNENHNISEKFISLIKNQFPNLELEKIAEIIFYYCYGILFATKYRQLYAHALIYEFPRIPIAKTESLLTKVSELGKILANLHLITEKEVYHPRYLQIQGEGKPTLTDFLYIEGDHKIIMISQKNHYCIGPVSPSVWNFTVGGYCQLQLWLNNFKGKELNIQEFNYFIEMIENITQTLEIIEKIDLIYPEIDIERN